MLHCLDGKADCSDVLYILSVRMSVYHDSPFPSRLLAYSGAYVMMCNQIALTEISAHFEFAFS